ncbi:hypothetical protein H6770_03780 [Candidatus Peribacteria bacterium]|nr:hypothetical protein [Candidatus Peribacteria bacterium]
MKKLLLTLLVLLSLPALLFIYNPSMHLGAIGLMLGAIGMTISPVILYTVLLLYVKQKWK